MASLRAAWDQPGMWWGLLRRQVWARKPAYAILGAYVLIGWSVAGMGCSLLISGDPDASVAMVVSVTGIACAGAVFAYFLYRPLFRAQVATAGAPEDQVRGGYRSRALPA